MSNNMTPNIDKIIQSLQKNTQQLDNLNEQMNDLSNSSQDLYNTIKLNKEYNDELNYLNNLSTYNTRASLIAALEQERKTIQELENENLELESAIQNHQKVLNVIMTKYREQGHLLEKLNQLEQSYEIQDDLLFERENFFQTKLNELVPLLDSVGAFDEIEIQKQDVLIQKMIEKNNKIKKLLQQQLYEE
uniref:FGFR1 oncogene partner 2 homolog n=1 Tax=Dermatophagoides pteronyssinus TaxID=6956 RepID=A0A6P6Y555_DERPT|nr:FGFR1 oncogene partner 2 homolog [Dermatophagoides pteronyssinus]